ncbi:MAG: uracil-DNA glycosylase [Hyphomicrobiales bacterium]|nr:uracil-DNA glycosylase [Hyphomicrobiales bacterium]
MNISRDDALRILDWYAAMGVGDAVTSDRRDWFANNAPSAQNAAPPAAPKRVVAAPAPTAIKPVEKATPSSRNPAALADPGAVAARGLARSAASISELRELLMRFDGCPLKKTAKHLCFSRGADSARIMFIGEAPGREEDLEGAPFVGPAGRLLDQMLAAIGLDESSAHITNVVYWRPPGNRTPTPQETQACQPFLERQIDLVNPEILVMLGGAAAKQMLDAQDGIMKLRGKWLTYEGGERPRRAIATLHPAYLLRTPIAKRLAWRDLVMIQSALETEQ